MFAIIGATGNVGYATAQILRDAGVQVRAVLRDETKAARLTKIGCEIAVANLQDAKALAKAISGADTVQVILPPAPQDKDTAAQMRLAIQSLATALETAHPKRILAISDYGAHVKDDIGIPSVFHTLETRLSQLDCHKTFLRSAEHMQGWGRVLGAVKASDTLPSFHDPADAPYPTISAPDLGVIAGQLLLEAHGEQESLRVVHAEGPQRYSADDAAKAVGELLGKSVQVATIPRAHWKDALGMLNASLAELLIKTNDAQNRGELVDVEEGGEVRYGTTTLIDALRPLVLSSE